MKWYALTIRGAQVARDRTKVGNPCPTNLRVATGNTRSELTFVEHVVFLGIPAVGEPRKPVSTEISDLCEISDLLLFLSYFASQHKKITSGNYLFDVC